MPIGRTRGGAEEQMSEQREPAAPAGGEPTPITEAPPPASDSPVWNRLRWPTGRRSSSGGGEASLRNAQTVYQERLSVLDRFAVAITDRVGSFGFFLIIFAWTVLWCGYNILASEVKALHWKAFDPFPAFVAYLLISNVIQILLMPLIMIGQNLQSRFADTRAQLDFEVNRMAEQETSAILRHLEHQTNLLLLLMQHLNCVVPDEEMRRLERAVEQEDKLVRIDPVREAASNGNGAATAALPSR